MSDRPSDVSQDNSGQIIPVDQEPLVAVPERSSDQEVPAAQHLEELTREVLELKLDYLSEAAQHLEELAREVLELKLDYLSEAENRSRSLKRLRAQVKWLTGILLVAIAVLGDSLIWLTYNLNLFPNQLERKIQSTTPDQQELETQAKNLETSVNKPYQALTVLLQALQDRVEADNVATPPNSPETSNQNGKNLSEFVETDQSNPPKR